MGFSYKLLDFVGSYKIVVTKILCWSQEALLSTTKLSLSISYKSYSIQKSYWIPTYQTTANIMLGFQNWENYE